MATNSRSIEDVKKLSNKELVEVLRHYNLYATSNGGDKHALVINGKEMFEEVKRRLLIGEETSSKDFPASGFRLPI